MARNSDADSSLETQDVLVTIVEQKLWTAHACTKCFDEMKWSETKMRPRRDVSMSRDRDIETETTSLVKTGGHTVRCTCLYLWSGSVSWCLAEG